MITGTQIQAGRTLLGWDAFALSRRAGLTIGTIVWAEASKGEAAITHDQEEAIRAALTGAGIEFVAENDGTPGVRLRSAAESGG
jgi:hypothetical protein